MFYMVYYLSRKKARMWVLLSVPFEANGLKRLKHTEVKNQMEETT